MYAVFGPHLLSMFTTQHFLTLRNVKNKIKMSKNFENLKNHKFANFHLPQKRLKIGPNFRSHVLSMMTANIWEHFKNFICFLKFQNIKIFCFYLSQKRSEIERNGRNLWITYIDCSRIFLFAYFWFFFWKFWFWLHFFANFHSGCIFLNNFIQAAYLCKILFKLHICANFNVHIFYLQ